MPEITVEARFKHYAPGCYRVVCGCKTCPQMLEYAVHASVLGHNWPLFDPDTVTDQSWDGDGEPIFQPSDEWILIHDYKKSYEEQTMRYHHEFAEYYRLVRVGARRPRRPLPNNLYRRVQKTTANGSKAKEHAPPPIPQLIRAPGTCARSAHVDLVQRWG